MAAAITSSLALSHTLHRPIWAVHASTRFSCRWRFSTRAASSRIASPIVSQSIVGSARPRLTDGGLLLGSGRAVFSRRTTRIKSGHEAERAQASARELRSNSSERSAHEVVRVMHWAVVILEHLTPAGHGTARAPPRRGARTRARIGVSFVCTYEMHALPCGARRGAHGAPEEGVARET